MNIDTENNEKIKASRENCRRRYFHADCMLPDSPLSRLEKNVWQMWTAYWGFTAFSLWRWSTVGTHSPLSLVRFGTAGSYMVGWRMSLERKNEIMPSGLKATRVFARLSSSADERWNMKLFIKYACSFRRFKNFIRKVFVAFSSPSTSSFNEKTAPCVTVD